MSIRRLLPVIISLSVIIAMLPSSAAAETVNPQGAGKAEDFEKVQEISEDVQTGTPADGQLAQDGEAHQDSAVLNADSADLAERTIMLYICASDLESFFREATHNLHQILQSSFSRNDRVRLVVMTGGAEYWYMESDYLYDPASGRAPEEISSVYNQIWEAKGLDDAEHPGKLVLLDSDGISGDGDAAKPSEEELMTCPDTLKAFINFSVRNFPAEKYDLILWDHGSGPVGGYAVDEHMMFDENLEPIQMLFGQILDALADNDVTRNGGKFDFLDFDACLMSSAELSLMFADYADYYIASPETEPGDGQDYRGWLDMLGEDPDMDTFELGKKIIDDFITYYSEPDEDGNLQDGTLSVIDLRKLVDSGFVYELSALTDILKRQVSGTVDPEGMLFYDELVSALSSISYGGRSYYDLGNFLSQLGIALREINAADADAEELSSFLNEYTETVLNLLQILNDPEIIYARGTEGIYGAPRMILEPDGNTFYQELHTSGLYIFFPSIEKVKSLILYYDQLDPVINSRPRDSRTELLDDYRSVILDYALVQQTGKTVSRLAEEGMEKSAIDYAAVREKWTDSGNADNSVWKDIVLPLLNRRDGGDDEAAAWLEALISQQAAEAVSTENVTALADPAVTGTGYRITISDTRKRILDNIDQKLIAELPAAEAFLAERPGWLVMKDIDPYAFELVIGTTRGNLEFDFGEYYTFDKDFLGKYCEWYNNNTSSWYLPAVSEEWYALQDADGSCHVACVNADDYKTEVTAVHCTESGEYDPILLIFRDNQLSEIKVLFTLTGARSISVADLEDEWTVTTAIHCNVLGKYDFYIPASLTDFTISSANAGEISLTQMNIRDLEDVQDTDGDGLALSSKVVLRDIYGYEYDISDAVNRPAGSLTDIADAVVEHSVYNGSAQRPKVRMGDTVLTEGKDYLLIKDLFTEEFRAAGDYEVILTGTGIYTGTEEGIFTIDPAPLSEVTISGIEDQVYAGQDVVLPLELRFGDALLTQGEDYLVSYRNNTGPGTAEVIIEGQGNFTGVLTETFEIREEPADPITAFVTRLYRVCLDRDPDNAGLQNWVIQLREGRITGVKAAQGFIFSAEFKNKNYCSRHFVQQLYRAFMGREPDEGGWADWINRLETGKTREEVFNGFALSPEFTKLCSDYGISRGKAIGVGRWGTVPTGPCGWEGCGEEDGVTAFVKRLYNIALNREAEEAGLADWTGQLWAHTNTGKGVAKGFIFSAEFTARNLNNEEFVDCMYHTFFDRDADAAGKANWVRQLNAGKSRESVFYGFSDSTEFSNLCVKYGITSK